ncbi:MAG: OmpA family protein, partial [Prevotella sp.]|nr:OmpA family protein [Prevotella sp.]
MKRTLLVMAVAVMAAQAVTAQTVAESKTTDNWYVSVNSGLNFKTTHTSVLSNLNPSLGLRIGRYFTPVFGMAIEGETYMNNKGSDYRPLGTFIKGLNLSVLGTT